MMSKRSLKQREELPYKELVDALSAFGYVIAIALIIAAVVIGGLMMQAPLVQGHEVGWV